MVEGESSEDCRFFVRDCSGAAFSRIGYLGSTRAQQFLPALDSENVYRVRVRESAVTETLCRVSPTNLVVLLQDVRLDGDRLEMSFRMQSGKSKDLHIQTYTINNNN